MDRIEKNILQPQAILLTHAHRDHIGAVSALQRHFTIPLFLHEHEVPTLQEAHSATSWLPLQPVEIPTAYHLIRDEQDLIICSLTIKPLFTPGHTPGGLTYLIENHAFVGDLIFAGSVGRTDLTGGSHDALLMSITNAILTLPKDTILHPGHGPSTTVEYEANNNPFVF
jgi:glyoxylase-like metal-dependent hydrolase (beta-lactamase superfamily II)